MREVFLGGLPAYQFQLLENFSGTLKHAVFSREGGVSPKPFDSLNVRFGIGDIPENVVINRARICDALSINHLISANQTHSNHVQMLGQEFLGSALHGDPFNDVDGFITNIPGVPLMIQVADCQAILFFEPQKKVIAAIHAGWKGLTKDIIGVTMGKLLQDFEIDPAKLLVGISPSLGPCCAFFSDPHQELPQDFRPYIDKEKRVDLWAFCIDQLQKYGIQAANIELAKICTHCGSNTKKGAFFSYRREQTVTGRFAAVIVLKS